MIKNNFIKMKIFLLFITILAIVIIGRKFFYSAKRNLFKDQAAWSGKYIKIKYNTSRVVSNSKKSNNILTMIANESKNYLEDQSNRNEDEIL